MKIRSRSNPLVVTTLILALSAASGGGALAEDRPAAPPDRMEGPARHGSGGPHGPDIGEMLERNSERLGLSEETKKKIREISEAARKDRSGLETDLEKRHEELRKLLDQDSPDRSAVMKNAEAIGDLRMKLQKKQLGAMLDVRALLTPEQRKELAKIHEERRDRRGERREMRRDGRKMDGPPPERRRGKEGDR